MSVVDRINIGNTALRFVLLALVMLFVCAQSSQDETLDPSPDGCPCGYACVYPGGCEICPAGTFSSASAPFCVDTSCQYCQPGTYSSKEGQCDSCSLCPAGTFTSVSGSTVCTACGPGNFSYPGESICRLCPAGYMSSGQQNSYCELCPKNTYSTPGSISCTPCPQGFMSNPAAAACAPSTFIPISYLLTDGSSTSNTTFTVFFSGNLSIKPSVEPDTFNVLSITGSRSFCTFKGVSPTRTSNSPTGLLRTGTWGQVDNGIYLLNGEFYGISKMGIGYTISGSVAAPNQSQQISAIDIYFELYYGPFFEAYSSALTVDSAPFNSSSTMLNIAGGVFKPPRKWCYQPQNADANSSIIEIQAVANTAAVPCTFGLATLIRSTFRSNFGGVILDNEAVLPCNSNFVRGPRPITIDICMFTAITYIGINYCIVGVPTYYYSDCFITSVSPNALYWNCLSAAPSAA